MLAGSTLMAVPLADAPTTQVAGFDSLTTGVSVEGLGAVLPGLNIDAVTGTAVVIEAGNSVPQAYTAPRGFTVLNPGPAIPNNCLEGPTGERVDIAAQPDGVAKGFSDIQARNAQMPQEIRFTFGGSTVGEFALRVFDFGDFNPLRVTDHSLTMTAFDTGGNPIDVDELVYTSPADLNPTSSDRFGDLKFSGDACTAADDLSEPGYHEFRVRAPGISAVEITAAGQDPNIGFDTIEVTDRFCAFTIGFWKNHSWEGQTITFFEGTGDELIIDEVIGQAALKTARGNNFSMLVAQLIAAKLNCGGDDCTGGDIDAAEDLLQANGVTTAADFQNRFPNKQVKREAGTIKDALDRFNNSFPCEDAK